MIAGRLRLRAATLLACTGWAMAVPPELSIQQAGVGDILPIGRTAGLEVLVTPGDLEPGTYLLEWERITPDGDRLLYQRRIPLAGGPVRAWIHGPVPRHDVRSMPVRLRRADDLAVLASTNLQLTPGTGMTLAEGTELILVVGQRRFGLEGYESTTPDSAPVWSQIATTLRTIDADELPDRLDGLSGVSTMLWTGSTEGLDRARASVLRGWMEAGGHLIISLPSVGDPWRLGASEGPWRDLLPWPPRATQLRSEHIAPILSPDALLGPVDTTVAIRVFGSTVGTSTPTPWHTVLELPDDQPLAIARAVGFGRLTVIGLDVAEPALLQFQAAGPLPSPAVFWNPILARRGDAPTPRQDRAAMDAGLAAGPPAKLIELTDEVVAGSIRQTVAAGGRLLFVLGWLAVCWLIGGPVLWRVLGRMNRQQLSWPIFTLLAAGGAALAAAAGGFMSLQAAEARHFTILEQVAGTPRHHVRSWIDLRLPGTGEHLMSVERQPGERPRLRHWVEQSQSSVSFADTRTLQVDADTPEFLPVQARSTAIGLALDWFGVLDPEDWGGVFWVVDPVTPTPNRDAGPPLRGIIQSELPAPLRNVSIMWIEARHPPSRTQPLPWKQASEAGHMPARVWWWKLSGEIPPKGQISLGQLPGASEKTAAAAQLDAAMASHERAFGAASSSQTQRWNAAELLSLYRLVTPPQWQTAERASAAQWTMAHRRFGADLDLGAQLGTPMLIVTGFLGEADLPIPLMIDGQAMNQPQGETMVRWFLPMPDTPTP